MSANAHDPLSPVHRFYVPETQSRSPATLEREPGQERDLPGEAFLRVPETPTGPPLWNQLIGDVGAERAAQLFHDLWQEAKREKRNRVFSLEVGYQTDASGNAVQRLFDVPAGYQAQATRCLVELGGKAIGSAVTAGATVALLESEQGTGNPAAAPVGQLRAFAPQNSSSGLFLPQLLVDDGLSQAPLFRGGRTIMFQLGGSVGALANTPGAVNLKLWLQEIE